MSKRTIATAVALVCAAVAVIGVATVIVRAGDWSSPVNVALIREHFNREGVPVDVQDRLIRKLRAGQLWDSQRPGAPSRSHSRVEGGSQVMIQTFDDGSQIINRVETPAGTLGGAPGEPQASVEGCRSGSGVGSFPFYDCRVSTEQFLLSMSFLCDGMTSDIGHAQVFNYRDLRWVTLGGTVTDHGFTLIRGEQSGESEAAVQANMSVNYTANIGSHTLSLTFHVRDTSKWDTSP